MKILPTLLTLSAVSLGVVTAFAQTSTHHSVKKHTKAVEAVVDPTIVPLVGTWYVHENGKESHAQRLSLRKNGTFAFIGSGWKSEGKFSVKANALALEWTAVDGAPVKAGTMHKAITLSANKSSFVIDRYTYAKHVE
ncbi:MAG TPA: hypothetical protein VGL56_11645 [Fimbriimonadaceae bacterium]|jgi:hypothetical protein